MKKHSSLLCTLLAILLLASSVANVLLPSEHDCMHVGCQICQFISIMERLFGAILLLLITTSLCDALTINKYFVYYHCPKSGYPHETPIELRVKLSN